MTQYGLYINVTYKILYCFISKIPIKFQNYAINFAQFSHPTVSRQRQRQREKQSPKRGLRIPSSQGPRRKHKARRLSTTVMFRRLTVLTRLRWARYSRVRKIYFSTQRFLLPVGIMPIVSWKSPIAHRRFKRTGEC